jgi:hypothetical protein
MKSIFDSSFKYRPSFKTDVRETFLRVRQGQQTQIRHEQQGQVRRDRQASADTWRQLLSSSRQK